MFTDSEEYVRRMNTPFTPPDFSVAELHAHVPKHLFRKSTWKALGYVARNVALALLLYKAALYIDEVPLGLASQRNWSPRSAKAVQWGLWLAYWWWQGLVFGGFWTLGHEAGHGNFSHYKWVNDVLGFILHTFLLIPYYAWRSSHHAHHKATGSLEREENYVPRTRADHGLPAPSKVSPLDYSELFEEAPLVTLLRMIAMQFAGWQAYLLCNIQGSPAYPPGTNHFSPSSALFKRTERAKIIASNIGLAVMSTLLVQYGMHHGLGALVKRYVVPYLLANHWVVMLTFLHHSDPTIPHYRKDEWSFIRGALATVDRPLLGWIGRVLLHNVSHDHIAHHLFSSIPFYNQPQVTKVLRGVLGEHYNYDSSNTFWALYRSFTDCCFVEDNEAILFYKDRKGNAKRALGKLRSGSERD
ncbi:fatty acid desaturase-domain-containing protein [Gautieria morchelliformis]|nr:fatty acid desaturase-domain-containing protein [Gautieria morchelliformis]